MTVLRALLLGTFVLAAGAQSPLAEYHNARFGYGVSYPKQLFQAMPEADNGDGRVFRARSGHAEARVWGAFVVADAGLTLKDVTMDALKTCVAGGSTYRLDRPGLQVVSCVQANGDIHYDRIVEVKGTLVQLQVVYPAAEKAKWDPVAAEMSKSLHAFGAAE